MTKHTILVTNPVPDAGAEPNDEWRGRTDRPIVKDVSVDTLAQSAQDMVKDLSEIISKIDVAVANLELDTVEISAAITASGKLSLVNIVEGGLGMEGSITFTFKRAR